MHFILLLIVFYKIIIIIFSVVISENSCAAYYFCENFFQDYLMNRNDKSAVFIWKQFFSLF